MSELKDRKMTVWYNLKDKKPVGPGPFLYFPCMTDVGHTIQISNGDYLRGPYSDIESTQWAEIDKPDGYEEVNKEIENWSK